MNLLLSCNECWLRFLPVVFEELPKTEWQQVVAARLARTAEPHLAEACAKRMVDFHTSFASLTSAGPQKFAEVTAYSSVSIRELLKWVGRVEWHMR